MTVGPPAADITHIARELAPTGTLRAAINLGNLVLTNGSHDDPAGVTVDIAREAARRLGVPLRLHLVDAARLSVDALLTGAAGGCFARATVASRAVRARRRIDLSHRSRCQQPLSPRPRESLGLVRAA